MEQIITDKEGNFRYSVEQKVERDISFVLAVYQTLDKFLAEEIENSGTFLACKKSCSACCYQMVTCTKPEMKEIVIFVKNMTRENRRRLKKRLKKFGEKWQKYFKNKKAILEINPFQSYDDYWGKPCPFLNPNTGACDIYPVRPIDCRTYSSVKQCTSGLKEPMRFRFWCEKLANNMIMEEQERIANKFFTVAVHNWIYGWLCKDSL
jgi:Fe-S-cluster containining protein